jgi:hypothetical protein
MKCVLAILGLCLLPPGKVEKPKPVVVHDHCEIYETIRGSRRDTPGTLRQIDRENSKSRAICGE